MLIEGSGSYDRLPSELPAQFRTGQISVTPVAAAAAVCPPGADR